MRARLCGLIAAVALALPAAAGLAVPARAEAIPVVVLAANGRASVRADPFLTDAVINPEPAAASRGGASSTTPGSGPHQALLTVTGELSRFLESHAITVANYRRYTVGFGAALAASRRLRGTRASELDAVIENLRAIAAGGLLTPSRLPALFETLDRNRQWWTDGPLLSSGERVEFASSELVWEYYPGQGIELQVLGSFGKADGLYAAGPRRYPRLRRLLAELIPLAARRGGGLTWEYYFNFDGGRPPWTSAMSQGTALEALTRAFKAFGERSYLRFAQRALPIFSVPPIEGVAVRTRLGVRYLLYSFAPGAKVINGFLQALIGLHDYAYASGSRLAARLFAAGDAEARAELPLYDTGAWSLYQPGQEDTLDYHMLVTSFLHNLCSRTHARVYCRTAQRFDEYERTPPSLTLLTHRLPAQRQTVIRFGLSKQSHVGIVVVRSRQIVFSTSASFPYGARAFSVPPLRSGGYTIRLAATDLAGNFSRIIGVVWVS